MSYLGLFIVVLIYNIIAISIAFLMSYFSFCMEEGNIFSPYRELLESIPENVSFIGKPLGLCSICTSFWVSLILFIIFKSLFLYIHSLYIIPFIGISCGGTLLLERLYTYMFMEKEITVRKEGNV